MTNHQGHVLDVHHPIFTIEHIAALFHVSVDRAREYTYRTDFPASRDLGARNLWDRDEVLDWFRALPRRSFPARPADKTSKKVTQTSAVEASAPATPAPAGARSRGALKRYQPRSNGASA